MKGELKTCEQYERAIRRLHCDRPQGRPRPHKAVMLLAVSLLAEADELPENRIEYNPRLLEIFRSLFTIARCESDKNTPHNPFFYLKSEGFWHLHPQEGRRTILEHMRNIRGPGELRENIAHASLDPELFELMRAPDTRKSLQAALVQEYCSHATDQMWAALKDEARIEAQKQTLLRETSPNYSTQSEERVRSTAFRRMIREIYDVRCAACGVRFFFADVDLIDAAHLIPFSTTQDDRPQNGMALCKNHHWLMDHAILAPGPGQGRNYAQPVWHVRSGLDDRLEEHKPVIELKGRRVIMPLEARYAPGKEGLDWRMERLKSDTWEMAS